MSTDNLSLSSLSELLKHLPESLNKKDLVDKLNKLKNTKVNILIVGVTGAGKSSTINALFNTNVAKVGQGSDPETSEITSMELNNIVIWDTPGLGDDKEKDQHYKKLIQSKLAEKDSDGNALIDLVLYVLDGTSKNLGTDYDLLETTIIPALKSNNTSEINRLIIAINKADQAMSGKNWDDETNQPKEKLISFLDEKVQSTKDRLFKNTGILVDPIYYSAGYKEEDEVQKPYNMAKLYYIIAERLQSKKRTVILEDKNRDETNFSINDGKKNYEEETEKTVFSSIKNYFGKKLIEFWEENKETVASVAKAVGSYALKKFGDWLKNKTGKKII